MAMQETILTIVAIRKSIHLLGEIVDMVQAAAGITDEQMAKAEAGAEALHNQVQETP